MAQSQAAKVSSRDLLTTCTDKLEPLPKNGITHGTGSSQISEKQREWLEMMTERADRENSSPEVLFAVGQYYFTQQDYAKALEYFEKAAKTENKGNVFTSQAKYQLGVMYYDGLGVKEDSVKGSKFMMEIAQSTDKNDADIISSAQFNLGRAYFMGFGVPQSDSEAEKWWCLAASTGRDSSSVRAQQTLGLFYSRQESFNLKESYKWHREAATNNNLESMAALGLMLIQGKGCERSDSEGLEWLRKSSQLGCVYGGGLLSRQYYVMKLFSKAAETAFRISEIDDSSSQLDCTGIAIACFVLARCLQLGQAVTKNESKAMEYYKKAKQFDIKVVAEMHKQLTHGQL